MSNKFLDHAEDFWKRELKQAMEQREENRGQSMESGVIRAIDRHLLNRIADSCAALEQIQKLRGTE